MFTPKVAYKVLLKKNLNIPLIENLNIAPVAPPKATKIKLSNFKFEVDLLLHQLIFFQLPAHYLYL